MADKNMNMPVNGRGSDSDDDELAALREAALRSKRMRVDERKPVETALQITAASQPLTPLVVACPFDRRQLPRLPFGGRGQMRLPRVCSQNFIRNARSNLIVIQTVPMEEDKPVAPPPKLEVHTTSQEISAIVRPQDRWAPSNDAKQYSSPGKPKVPTKFDRYDSSGSESEEDLSSHEGSDSEGDSVSVSQKKTHEPQPTSELLHSDSAFTETNADLPASDASSLDSLTNSSELLLDSPRNSPTTEQVLENSSSKRSLSKSIPSTENSPSNVPSLLQQSKSLSSTSSKSVCSLPAKEIIQSATLSTGSKSPVSLKSQSDSRSSSRSCSPANSRLLETQAQSCISAASPTPPRSRSKSPMHVLTSCVKSPSYRRSPVRTRSPVGLRSPVHLRSRTDSKSPVNLLSPLRLRSKSRSMSCSSLSSSVHLKSRSKSRSPVVMRSLSSRSKTSSRSPVHLRLKSHSKSPEKLSSHVRHRNETHSRTHVNSKSLLYSELRASSRSPGNISSRVHPRPRTRSRSPASRTSEVPLRSRTHSRSPPSLPSSKLYRSPSNQRSPSRFSKSPVCKRSPGHSESPVYSRSHEHLRSPTQRSLPLVSRSPGRLKEKAASRFLVQSGSSEHIHLPAHTRSLRVSRSPEHSLSVHSTSPKTSRSPRCYWAPAHSRSPRNSRSPGRYRSPGCSNHAEITRSSRRYRSLERSLSPRQVGSRTHSRSPRIPRLPLDLNSSKLSLIYSQSGGKSRLRLPRSRSPYSRSSSPGNGSYRLTSKMVKRQNGGFSTLDPKLQPEKGARREEMHLHGNSRVPLDADRITSKSSTYHHSSHYSTGTDYRPTIETRRPEGGLNSITNSHNWIDSEKHSQLKRVDSDKRSQMKRISPDLKKRSSDYLKDQNNWWDLEVGTRNEKSAELRLHASGYVKDQRSVRDTEIGTRAEKSADLRQHHSDYDQVLEIRKHKFDNVGVVSAEEKTLLLHSGRLKSRSDTSTDRGKTDKNFFRRDGYNCKKYDNRNEHRIRKRNDHKPDSMQSRLDPKLDVLCRRGRGELKRSGSKTDASAIRSRSASRGFSTQKSSIAFAKAAEKSLEADECDSKSLSSESVSSDPEAGLSQCRPSLSDDSDSEAEASGPREKHFTERNDLPTKNPVSKLTLNDKFRRQGFRGGTTRRTEGRQNIIGREDSRMRQSYIQPLMEGLRFGKLRSRSPSPRRLPRSPSRSPAAKRVRNDSPPVKSVLSIVKLAKTASSTDVSLCSETKRSDQSDETVPLVKLPAVKRSSDEDKSSVAEAGNSPVLSDIRKDARSIVKKMDDKSETGVAPSSDQRTIQITFNQKMGFDESVKLPSRRSVHQRLGKLEIGARKDKTVELSSSQAEEKKFVDLRDLIGEKSRQIVYRVDSPAAEEREETEDEAGTADELFLKRKKSRTGRRRRKFNDNLGAGSGKLEGRLAGRSNYS